MLVLVAAGLWCRRRWRNASTRIPADRVLLLSFNPGLVRYDPARASSSITGWSNARVRYLELRRWALPFTPLGVNNGSLTLLIDGAVRQRVRPSVGRRNPRRSAIGVMRTIVHGRALTIAIRRRVTRRGRQRDVCGEVRPNDDPMGKTAGIPDIPGPKGAQTLSSKWWGSPRTASISSFAESPRVLSSIGPSLKAVVAP